MKPKEPNVKLAAFLLLPLMLALALPSLAQFGGGQGRTRSSERTTRAADRPAPRPQNTADPLIALERELPSLGTDLKLTPEQAVLWDSFVRSARDAAEIARARMRQLATLRSEQDKSVTALALIGSATDSDLRRAEAMKTLLANLTALYDTLSPQQKLLLDRRFGQAQADPLGTS
jgi:LTXXQ motif family protein